MELDIVSTMNNMKSECSHLLHDVSYNDGTKYSAYLRCLFEADQASLNEIKDVLDVAIKEMEDHGFIMTSNTVQPTDMEGLEYCLEFVPRTKNAMINYLNKKPMVNKIDNLEEKSLAELVKIIEQLNNR